MSNYAFGQASDAACSVIVNTSLCTSVGKIVRPLSVKWIQTRTKRSNLRRVQSIVFLLLSGWTCSAMRPDFDS